MWNFDTLAEVGNKILGDALKIEGVIGIGVLNNKLVIYLEKDDMLLEGKLNFILDEIDTSIPYEYKITGQFSELNN